MYEHIPEDRWTATRTFGVNRREDPETEHPDGMTGHLGGDMDDLATNGGDWGDKCVERVEGEDVVLPYSDGPVKGVGTFCSGACHVKGGTLRYSHKDFFIGHLLRGAFTP